jgi:ATP-dependent helicase/nuclease subunit B
MSLRFIYGRAGSGKTRYCLDEIKSKIADGMTRPLVLLVPEQYTYQAERDLITVLQTGGILKTEVLSFRRLAFRVFNETGGLTYPHIHAAGKSMIICRILDKMRDGLKVFTGVSEHHGFINNLSSLITELKKYDITPDRLESAASMLEEGLSLKDKLTELRDIYAEYEKIMAERYRDSDDDLTLAARKLKYVSRYDRAEIWIDGFSGFTPQEYNIIGCLLKKAERVNISLCTDCLDGEEDSEGTDVFYPVKRVFKKAVRIAEECGIPVEPPVALKKEPLYRFRKSAELSHLERNLDAYPYRTFREKTKDISLFSSVNTFSEVEAAAGDIIRLCRDKGLRYRDIAVVASNLEF